MYAEARRKHSIRTAVLVAAVTLLAVAVPVGAPLYAAVYGGPEPGPGPQPGPGPEPGPDPKTLAEALSEASLDAGFDSATVTQFETTTFRATVIYDTLLDPDLPTVQVAWSNQAVLTPAVEGAFTIVATSADRQFLDNGTSRPEGGFALTWTWDVTPLVAGEQTLTVSILPTVVIEGDEIDEAGDINQPIPVTVDVHPVVPDFQEVLTAAASMQTDMPDEMFVGEQYEISASMSLAGHADTVTADIQLTAAENSAAVRIAEASAAVEPAPASAGIRAAAHVTAAVPNDRFVKKWTVTVDEPGQVALVFTATLHGQAGIQELQQAVPVAASAPATQRPSFWETVQRPVLYISPFIAAAAGVLGLWAAWKKRNAGREADAEHAAAKDSDS